MPYFSIFLFNATLLIPNILVASFKSLSTLSITSRMSSSSIESMLFCFFTLLLSKKRSSVVIWLLSLKIAALSTTEINSLIFPGQLYATSNSCACCENSNSSKSYFLQTFFRLSFAISKISSFLCLKGGIFTGIVFKR